MDGILPPEIICDFIHFFHTERGMQNSEEQSLKREIIKSSSKEHQKNGTASKGTTNTVNFSVSVTVKKPQVIQLDSSDQNEKVKAVGGIEIKTVKKMPQKSKKIKKGIKCPLCKQQGKFSMMKRCDGCKNHYHILCLGLDDKPIPKKVLCDKCKMPKLYQERAHKQLKKLDPRQLQLQKISEKMNCKKIEKQKKKQQQYKKIDEFLDRYPYYSQEGKVKFPIDDRLLLIYKQLFDVSDNTKLYPIPHPVIPSYLLGDLLQIENFFSTFNDQLDEDDFIDPRKTVLYFQLNCNGPDKTFKSMVGCLLKIYLKDVIERNKTENVKTLHENCFFTLLLNLSETEQLDTDFISKVSVQIIRFLSSIPSMKKAFQGFKYPEDINLQSKIYVLLSLIKGMSQVDSFHDLVSKRSDKIQEMTKERSDLTNRLKKDQAQALSNKEMMREINENEQGRLKIQNGQQQGSQNISSKITRRDKEADKHKKKIQKLTNQKQKSQIQIKQFRARVSEITKSISFMTSSVLLLGQDRNRSEYFFFVRQPHRMYVRFRQYIFSEQPQYLMFQGKQKILEFSKTLNTKGNNEKHLYDNINGLLKDNIIHNISEQDEYNDSAADFTIENRIDFRQEVSVQAVIESILSIQQSFSTYLLVKDLQWQNQDRRRQFLDKLRVNYDIQQLKETLKQLQQHFLFVQRIQDREQQENQSQEADQQEQKPANPFMFGGGTTKKKVAIRIWGINSQKIKKFWIQYLQNCVDAYGLWICVNIFKNYVDKYVKRKMQHLQQVQRKSQKAQKQRQKLKQRERQRQRQIMYEKIQRSRSRSREKKQRIKPKQVEISSEQKSSYRNIRKSTRIHKKKLNIDSDQFSPQQGHNSESQLSQDVCEECNQYGQMICCDTCPRVYHPRCVGIKEIPEGQWMCLKCLQKMANQRKTRSRSKRFNQLI